MAEWDQWSAVSTEQIAMSAGVCATCERRIEGRPGTTVFAVVNGLWCPGCAGIICDPCVHGEHGPPVAQHASVA